MALEKQSTIDELLKTLYSYEEGVCKSLMRKHLPPEKAAQLKDKKTKLGGTLADCIKSGKVTPLRAHANLFHYLA